jgi:hypothetical protein
VRVRREVIEAMMNADAVYDPVTPVARVPWPCTAEGCTCNDPNPMLASHYYGAPHKDGCGCGPCREKRNAP